MAYLKLERKPRRNGFQCVWETRLRWSLQASPVSAVSSCYPGAAVMLVFFFFILGFLLVESCLPIQPAGEQRPVEKGCRIIDCVFREFNRSELVQIISSWYDLDAHLLISRPLRLAFYIRMAIITEGKPCLGLARKSPRCSSARFYNLQT